MENAFLMGGYAPVREERTVLDLAVTGRIPEYLDGRYLRNGPNPAAEVDPATYSWFVGDGMVHGVRIRDGRAEWYRNRWVRSPQVAAALGEPYDLAGSTAPLVGLGANTNVIEHAGRTFALVEGGWANQELDDELGTVGYCDFDGTLPGGFTAHPKRDPESGELHAVSYFFGWDGQVRYSVIDTEGRARRTVDIPVGGSPMMHDFSLTESQVVIYDLPVTFEVPRAARARVPRFLSAPARLALSAIIGRVRVPDPVGALARRRSGTANPLPFRWNPDHPARVGVMPRDGDAGDLRWFEVEPCFVFHPLGAYDDGDAVVLDVVRYDRMFDVPGGTTEQPPALDRWTLDLGSGTVRTRRLDDRPQEYPRVDERLVGRRHRYGYTVGISGEAAPNDLVIKHDTVRGTILTRALGPGREAGEFVFAPSSPDSAEDDGVLMGFVYDKATDRSDLMLLDAATLDTVAAIHVPGRVPHGFHGNWAPGTP
jgi:carotenoid cleavage oxygenase